MSDYIASYGYLILKIELNTLLIIFLLIIWISMLDIMYQNATA